jgi:predicted lysophospholipase L1 biosynthesis ABC-type transport system permease subunit
VVPLIYTSFTGQVRPHGDSFAVVVKGSGDPKATLAALQAAVHDVDASIPIYEAEVLGDLTERSYWQRSALALALSCFAVAALVLAAIGLFGVTSYNVSERIGEIGIRRALGATRGRILRMILGDTSIVVALGLTLGLAGAWVARALLGTFVFGVSLVDPATYVAVCFGVALLSMLAALAAARGAARVEPSRTLTDA